MIQIVENFFTDKQLKMIQNFVLNKAIYTPKFLPNATEKNDQSSYGNRFCFYQEKSKKLYKLFVDRAKLKYKINILKIDSDSGLDVRKLTTWKFHVDSTKLNLLVMLYGEENIHTGTVFETDEKKFSTVIGFKPNRAILFPSTTRHSPHAALNNDYNVHRYSATLFIKQYKLIR